MPRADNFTTFMCRLSGNLGASTSRNPQRPVEACDGIDLPLLDGINCLASHFSVFSPERKEPSIPITGALVGSHLGDPVLEKNRNPISPELWRPWPITVPSDLTRHYRIIYRTHYGPSYGCRAHA